MSASAADRNLLFGILALQMDFIRRDALIAAMHAWVLDKARPLGQILLDQGQLSAERLHLLDGLVAEHLKVHSDDAERSLAALAAPAAVRAELQRIADPDVQASLAQLPVTPTAFHESLPTSAPTATDGERFQILRPHASGGLGDVFVAKDGELNREVALKEIQPRHAHHPESRARFVREAEITGGLEHPGIVPVYALGQYADGRPYYAMRFIKGDSLKEAIERFHGRSRLPSGTFGATGPARQAGPTFDSLEFRQLLNRFIAVCNAIAYAHSRGVLHRDLKPSNIMLGEFGETLIVDWGLAKVLATPEPEAGPGSTGPWLLPSASSDSDLTRTGQALGTPAYMSPEQAAGQLDQLGPASDIYSLGATLYCLLTGQAPFPKSEVGAVLQKVQKGDFPAPRQVHWQIPAALEAICSRAMVLRAQDRYPSTKALADDLEHWLADEAVTAHTEPWHGRVGRWVRHHKGLVGSAAAILALGTTIAIAGNELRLRGIAEGERAKAEKQKTETDTQRSEAEKQRKRADRYLYHSRIQLADRAWQETQIARMDELLEQTQPEHTGEKDLRGFEWYYLKCLRQQNILTLRGHTGWVGSVAYSPDGQRLASASIDQTVKIWDACTGREILTLKGQSASGHGVAFSPDGQRLAFATEDSIVKVWDVRACQEILSLKGHTKVLNTLAWSPDGQRLASADSDGTVKVWDARTGQECLTLRRHAEGVRTVAFSPDSQRLASGGYDKTIRVWDVHTGEEVFALEGHIGGVFGLAFSPDGQHLASGSGDGTIEVWDVQTRQEILALRGHNGLVSSLSFSPDGQHLASASNDRTVRIWDPRTGQQALTLRGHADGVGSVVFSPDGQRLASASSDHSVKVWDARTSQESLTLEGDRGNFHSIAFSPDGQRVARASQSGKIKVWDARTGQESLALKGRIFGFIGVVFSPDGRRLAGACLDQTVRVWDANTGQQNLTLRGHTNAVSSVAFSPDGHRLASAGWDQTVRVWDAQAGKEILTLKGHTSFVQSVAFCSDGQRLASGSFDRTVRVWDAHIGKEILILNGHTGNVLSVAFSPNGNRLASASLDRTVRVWDIRTGAEILTLQGHTSEVYSVAFSPDGQRLASSRGDGTLTIWDAITGQESLTLGRHAHEVRSVTFSPDGQRLASASIDGAVKVWDATPVSEESSTQRLAISYFCFAAETMVLKEDMIQQIRQTAVLSEPAREQALALAKEYYEVPDRLNTASWLVARASWAQPGAYRLALRQAEAACINEPENGMFLNTLGAAQYRTGQYEAALKTLMRSEKLNAARFRHSVPADLAFLAMTQFRLGQKVEAAATLGRLREVMKKLPPDREAEELLKEAEDLLARGK